MNERFKELLRESGMQYRLAKFPLHIDSNGTHTFQEFYAYDTFDPEKFAELIVLECAKLVEDNIDPQNAWITPAHIKRHFGVEK